jgi:hypothetical protein
MSYEPECLSKGMVKFFFRVSAMTPNDGILCDIWAKMLATGKLG